MSKNKNKKKELERIALEIENCEVCKQGKIGIAVPGEGSPDAKIIFIGEAPGKQEAKSGRPFIGRSGKLLRKKINEIGLEENEVFITSPVKYLPEKGTPTPQEIAHGRTHLKEQLQIIEPKLLVLLGNVASLAILEKKVSVMKEHGTLIKNNQDIFLTVHPAAALRFTRIRKIFSEDFQKLAYIISTLH